MPGMTGTNLMTHSGEPSGQRNLPSGLRSYKTGSTSDR